MAKPNKLLYSIVITMARGFFRLCYRHKTYGIEKLPPGGAVIAPNHVSFLDPPAIAVSSPDQIHFLARESLFHVPLFKQLISSLNAFPVKRNLLDIGTLKKLCQLIRDGHKVLIFPEGARSKDGELQPIKHGVSLIVRHSDSCVIPAYIHGTFAVWNSERRFPKFWGKTACVFGDPIFWQEFAHLDKKSAESAMTLRLEGAILQLKNWYDTFKKEKSK
jgi:1-acyl-sn-glycerol-3-phosphate acyltransferase